MTKINKLGKSTFVIAILSLLIVAVLAFGGTYAYFSAKSADLKGDLKMGQLKIGAVSGTVTSGSWLAENTVAQPGQKIFGENGQTVTAEVTSNIAYYTRVSFTVAITADTNAKAHTANCLDEYDRANSAPITLAELLEFTLTDGGVSGSGKAWESSTSSATGATTYYKLEPSAKGTTSETCTFNVAVSPKMGALANPEDATGCAHWQDAVVTITVNVEVLQADFLVNGTTVGAKFSNGKAADDAWVQALAGTQG